MTRQILRIGIAIAFILVPALAMAQVQTKYVNLGQTVAGDWVVIACHPASKELTLSRQHTFGYYSGFAETVRVGVQDIVWLGKNVRRKTVLVNYMNLSGECGGLLTLE